MDDINAKLDHHKRIEHADVERDVFKREFGRVFGRRLATMVADGIGCLSVILVLGALCVGGAVALRWFLQRQPAEPTQTADKAAANNGQLGDPEPPPGKTEAPPTSRREQQLDDLAKGSSKTDDLKSTTPGLRPSGSRASDLATTLVDARSTELDTIVENYRDSKGVDFTEALAIAAGKLAGGRQSKVREALAERLTRMTPATLHDCLRHPDREIRRAAALACGAKRDSAHVSELIRLLSDGDELVVQAARASLKVISGRDFGPEVGASQTERGRAVLAWRNWHESQSK